MKKQILTALAVAACVGALSPVAFAQNVAIVNGVAVPKERVEALAQQVARSGRQITPEMQGQLRDEVIAREIFAQEAHKRGLDATDDFKNQIEPTNLLPPMPAKSTRPATSWWKKSLKQPTSLPS
jgi:peptidyl-prolyl cis-trans isomerase C